MLGLPRPQLIAAKHCPPVPNIPLKCHITALQNLVDRALEPIRQQLGLPIKVNSGYRCQLVNSMVGGEVAQLQGCQRHAATGRRRGGARLAS